jgi:hypothetical protein
MSQNVDENEEYELVDREKRKHDELRSSVIAAGLDAEATTVDHHKETSAVATSSSTTECPTTPTLSTTTTSNNDANNIIKSRSSTNNRKKSSQNFIDTGGGVGVAGASGLRNSLIKVSSLIINKRNSGNTP